MPDARFRRARENGQGGFVLLISVIILLIASIVGIYAVSMTGLELDISSAEQRGRIAFNSAEAGIHYGLQQIPVLTKFPVNGADTCCDLPNGGRFQSGTYGEPASAVLYQKQISAPGYGESFKYNVYTLKSTGFGPNNASYSTIEAHIQYGPVPNQTSY